jgi:cytochrome c556
MTVDETHSHDNSSEQSVSTIETFIDEITLEDKVGKKEKKIVKATPKKAAPANWSKQEVATLIELLKRYGSDFTMISTKLPKTRDQIKRKFKVLEKKCPALADAIFERQPL